MGLCRWPEVPMLRVMFTSLWNRVEGVVGQKAARYTLVSGVSVAVTQVVLGVLVLGLDTGAATANFLAVSIGAVPSYLLNRAWTWGKTGKNHLWKEVVPFWAMALLGLVLSTALVDWAAGQWSHPLVPNIANLVAFGFLWVGKFFVLHLVLFKVDDPEPTDAPVNVC